MAIAIVFVDKKIKKMEERKADETKLREEYNEWKYALKQYIQITSKHLCDILETIDIILEMHEKEGIDKTLIDEENIGFIEDMLFVKIRILSKNLPTRYSFSRYKWIDINQNLYKKMNFNGDEIQNDLTVKEILGNLRESLNSLSSNINIYKENKYKLTKIEREIKIARMDFLKLKAKSFDEIYRKD